MTPRWDLAVYDRHDQLVLVAEVKNKFNAAPEWAGRLRRNILAHGVYPNAPFFLLALPDRFYLWTHSSTYPEYSEPDFSVDARPLLQPYFGWAGVNPAQISESSLELIVASWLSEVIHSDKSRDEFTPAETWLVDSGLHAALVGGRFASEVVA